jgi:hypothetical protein
MQTTFQVHGGSSKSCIAHWRGLQKPGRPEILTTQAKQSLTFLAREELTQDRKSDAGNVPDPVPTNSARIRPPDSTFSCTAPASYRAVTGNSGMGDIVSDVANAIHCWTNRQLLASTLFSQ